MRAVHVPGVVATILTVFGDNLWHWLVDSIPRLVSLRRALPAGERVTLIVPDHLHSAERDVLQALLPPNFSLKVVSKRTWIRGDRVILASFLTGRSNGFLPADWLGEIRTGVFETFGLRENGPPRERIWVSRARDRHRRVRNEGAVMAALAPLGFRSVHLAGMPAKEQIETFRSAEIVAGPYGAGLAWLLFSARIPVVVLYPDRAPNTHFVTQTSCLGQRHLFLTHDAPDEYTDFNVDIPALLAQVERAMAPAALP
jgi:capsular polysaccharide biosynthesis protein